MQPLHCPEIFQIDANETKAEKFWSKIPILGWGISGYLWQKRVEPIIQKVEQQLESRPKPLSGVWGRDETKVQLAQFVCAQAKEHMGWPNDHFIPEDPVAVVFWAHEDGLDVECAMLDIEDKYNIEIRDEDINEWFEGSVGQMIDAIYVKKSMW